MKVGDVVFIKNKHHFLKEYGALDFYTLDMVYPLGWGDEMFALLGAVTRVEEVNTHYFRCTEGFFFLKSDAILLVPSKKGNVFDA